MDKQLWLPGCFFNWKVVFFFFTVDPMATAHNPQVDHKSNWETLDQQKYHVLFQLRLSCQTSVYKQTLLLSKPVVSHTQASSKNGLFHLAQVNTAGGLLCSPATHQSPLFPFNYDKRTDKSAGLLRSKTQTLPGSPLLSPLSFSPSVWLTWLHIWWQWMLFFLAGFTGSSPTKWYRSPVQK